MIPSDFASVIASDSLARECSFEYQTLLLPGVISHYYSSNINIGTVSLLARLALAQCDVEIMSSWRFSSKCATFFFCSMLSLETL